MMAEEGAAKEVPYGAIIRYEQVVKLYKAIEALPEFIDATTMEWGCTFTMLTAHAGKVGRMGSRLSDLLLKTKPGEKG